MNAWISSELEKIDARTDVLLQKFDKIEKRMTSKDFVYYKKFKNKLMDCYSFTGSAENIHDIQDECERTICNYNESLL